MARNNEINRSDFFRRPNIREVENAMERVLLAENFQDIIPRHEKRTPTDFVEIGEEVNIIPKNDTQFDKSAVINALPKIPKNAAYFAILWLENL